MGHGRTYEVPIVETTDSFMGTSVYADIEYLSRLLGEEFAVTGVQLATDRDPKHTRELYRELKKLPGLEAVTSRLDMIKSLEETVIRNLWVFIGMIVVFAGIVFFGSILNASLVSLAERQRELATLRVLGYGPWQIGSLMLRESVIVTLIGTVLGMPIGYMLTVAMANSYESEMFRFPVICSVATFAWTMVLAIAFTFAAHLFVQRSVHKMKWLEALQAKE